MAPNPVSLRLPTRPTSGPLEIMPASNPTVAPQSSKPSSPSEAPKACLILGICTIHVPVRKPFVKTARQTATRTGDQLDLIITAIRRLKNRHPKAAKFRAVGFRLLGNQVVQDRDRSKDKGSSRAKFFS